MSPSQLTGPSARGYMTNKANRTHGIVDAKERVSADGGVFGYAFRGTADMAGAWEIAEEKESGD